MIELPRSAIGRASFHKPFGPETVDTCYGIINSARHITCRRDTAIRAGVRRVAPNPLHSRREGLYTEERALQLPSGAGGTRILYGCRQAIHVGRRPAMTRPRTALRAR